MITGLRYTLISLFLFFIVFLFLFHNYIIIIIIISKIQIAEVESFQQPSNMVTGPADLNAIHQFASGNFLSPTMIENNETGCTHRN